MGWAATHVFSVGEVLTAGNMNLVQNNVNATSPVGKLSFVAARSAGNVSEALWQTGWLECNGAAVSRSTYVTLYNYFVALTPTLPFGAGNGTTTFNLPDMQGRYPVHHTVAGHSDVGTLGNSESVTFDKRRPKHRTTNSLTGGTTSGPNVAVVEAVGGSTGALGGGAPWTNAGGQTHTHTVPAPGGSIGTNVANDSIDTSPYLVAGIWVIKF